MKLKIFTQVLALYTSINKWFDTSNYTKDIDRSLEKSKKKKVIGKFKDELGGLVMSEFCVHMATTYAFLIDGFNDNDYSKHGIVNKRAMGTKKMCDAKPDYL